MMTTRSFWLAGIWLFPGMCKLQNLFSAYRFLVIYLSWFHWILSVSAFEKSGSIGVYIFNIQYLQSLECRDVFFSLFSIIAFDLHLSLHFCFEVVRVIVTENWSYLVNQTIYSLQVYLFVSFRKLLGEFSTWKCS